VSVPQLTQPERTTNKLALTPLNYNELSNASPIYTALLAIAAAFHNVFVAGWRAPDGGLVMSLTWGLIVSAAVCTLAHVIGYGIARLVN
jgi:hypothetical protein